MIEVAAVFRRFAADYLSAHGASMLPSHRRAIEDILNCRTAALGGQLWRCEAETVPNMRVLMLPCEMSGDVGRCRGDPRRTCH